MILEPACHFLFIFVMVFALNQNNLTKVGLKRSWLFILVLHPLHKILSPSLIPYFIKEFIKYFSTIGFKRSKDVRRTSYAGETYTAHLQPGNNSWISPRTSFFGLWDWSQTFVGTSYFHLESWWNFHRTFRWILFQTKSCQTEPNQL